MLFYKTISIRALKAHAEMNQTSKDTNFDSSDGIGRDMLFIIEHQLDYGTFDDFMSCNIGRMRDLVNMPDKLPNEIHIVMPSYGYDEQSAKSVIAMTYRDLTQRIPLQFCRGALRLQICERYD